MEPLKIFISHNSEDNVFCEMLVKALREAGASVWFDEHNLNAGQLLETVEREIRSRQVFILILSSAALESQWVRNEATWAFNRTQRDPARIFLPIVAETVVADDIWLFIEPFRRIEAAIGIPYPPEDAIRRTLQALSLADVQTTPHVTNETADDLLTRANALYIQGHYEQAEDLAHVVLTADPKNTSAWYRLGYSLRELHRYNEALEAFNRVLAIDSTSATDWQGKADILWVLVRLEEALEAVTRALDLDPRFPRAWSTKGNILYRMKRYGESIAAHQRAIFLDPNNSNYWSNLAYCFIWMQLYDAALEAADIGLELEPNSVFSMENKAWALLGLRRYEDALRFADMTLRIDPKRPEPWCCGSCALYCLGRMHEASRWLEQGNMYIEPGPNELMPILIEQGSLVASR